MKDKDFQKAKYAVIFIGKKKENTKGFQETDEIVEKIVVKQPGYCGHKTFWQGEESITISYWKDEESIKSWRENKEHKQATKRGINEWFEYYYIQITEIKRQKSFYSP